MTRVFILGNGPSLNKTPLDKLIGEESWGMAEIQYIYDKTNWRPTRYWWNDHPQDIGHLRTVLFHVAQGYPCSIRRDVVEILTGEYDISQSADWGRVAYENGLLPYKGSLEHVHSWDYCVDHNAGLVRDDITGAPDVRRAPGWHDMDNDVLCKYGSGLNCMLQQAVRWGYDPIYLLGCDLGFKGYDARDGSLPDSDHFDPDYNTRYRSDFRAEIDEETHIDFHTHAQEWCKEHGVELYNATYGGYLEVHPRVNLGDIL